MEEEIKTNKPKAKCFRCHSLEEITHAKEVIIYAEIKGVKKETKVIRGFCPICGEKTTKII